MLTITCNLRMPHNAELASTEIWLDADRTGFAVMVVAVLIGGARLLAGTAAGCIDQEAAVTAAERMIQQSRLGQTFVSYHWGRPRLAPVPIAAALPTIRRVA